VAATADESFFPSRSAPILLRPVEAEDADSLAVVIDKSGSQLTGANTEAELSVYNVADVVNRVLGLQPVHPEFAPAFLKANAFTKVKANVLIAVESLGEEYLSNHHMSGLQQLRNDHHSFKLLGHRYPTSVAAMSASLATGASPAAHGVVADAWMNEQGEHVTAFSSPAAESGSVVGTSADVMTQAFHGHSLTVSVSADAAPALAHAPHHSIRTQHPSWNNVAVAIKGSSFQALFPTSFHSLTLALADLGADLSKDGLSLASNARFQVAEHTVTVSVDGQTAAFDLNVEEHVGFLGELVFVDHLLHELHGNAALQALVADEYPDAFTITLAGLRGLRARNGDDSTQMAVAMRLLDAAIPKMINRFSALYSNNLVAELVVMGSNKYGIDPKSAQKIHELLPGNVVGDFFPALYMRHGAVAHPALMCTRMRQLLAAHTPDVMAVCRGPAAAADSSHFKTMSSTAVLMQLSAAATAGNSTNPTDKEIQIYQICLWTGVALVAVLALAVYSLAYMSNRKDTMLYSKFNPNWSDRKRR